MMKNSLKKLLLGGAAVLALGVGADAYAQNTDNQVVPATATVIAPLDLNDAVTIDFGTFIPDTAATTIVIASDGTADNYNAATVVVAGGNGSFDINSDPARAVDITATTTLLTGGSGPDMALDPVTIEGTDASGGTYVHTAGGTADETLRIGGTLAVGAAQGAGTYTGNTTVTATYQ